MTRTLSHATMDVVRKWSERVKSWGQTLLQLHGMLFRACPSIRKWLEAEGAGLIGWLLEQMPALRPFAHRWYIGPPGLRVKLLIDSRLIYFRSLRVSLTDSKQSSNP